MILDLNSKWTLKYRELEQEYGEIGCIQGNDCSPKPGGPVTIFRSAFGSIKEAERIANEILCEENGWTPIEDIPCDVRVPLIKEGTISEPLEEMNSYESEWIEKKVWWFKKVFNADCELFENNIIEICLESLDIGADIFINGKYAGYQASSFYPFRKNVAGMLIQGENTLLVRLTSGIDRVGIEYCKPYHAGTEEKNRPGRGDRRRVFLRKPQCSFGWDWAARVATCCIGKNVFIEAYRYAAIRGANIRVKLSGCDSDTAFTRAATLFITVEIENFHPVMTMDCIVRADIYEPEATRDSGSEFAASHYADGLKPSKITYSCISDYHLKSGINYIDMEITINDAYLWWPNGMGEQPLYNVKISADFNLLKEGEIGTDTGGKPDINNGIKFKEEYPLFKYGIRTVEIDQRRINGSNSRLFAFVINGVRAFCKGANWIPADSLYARISDGKYKHLITEAREANFNMLRIWGGGIYERDIFYEMCDRCGIMLWHDMMFACAEYPEDNMEFMKEVTHEFEYQTKRLRNHPSVVLWCGNNENQQIYWKRDNSWGKAGFYGAKIYNYIIPEIIQKNCPQIPYWNSSAYGGKDPNSEDVGDRHHWRVCMTSPDMTTRVRPEEYDMAKGKFISEYGYIGPLKKSSVLKYLGGAQFEIQGEAWQHHNNTFERNTVLAGIEYHYGKCIYINNNIDLEKYLFYAGLCQGLMYGYSLESFRVKPECSGGLFWMYNDCWGETGWSIIDYYLIRKISYYFVKRALAPVKLILREEKAGNGAGDDTGSLETSIAVNITAINETPQLKELEIEYGYISFDGSVKDTKREINSLKPYSRIILKQFRQKGYDTLKGIYFARIINSGTSCSYTAECLRMHPYNDLKMPDTEVAIMDVKYKGGDTILTVSAKSYAHAVHFKLPDEINLSDEYFDMLPGESRNIIIYNYPSQEIKDNKIEKIKVFAKNLKANSNSK